MRFQDRTAIVTGASSGIGRAAALLLGREGANIIAGARGRQGLDALADDLAAMGAACAVLAGDVRDDAFAAGLVALAKERFGGVDLAFNNAGTLGALAPAHDLHPQDWRDTLSANLDGAFYCARHQVPAMLERGGGAILFTSTFVGHSAGIPGTAAYAASKAGLTGLVQVLAAELGTQRIRVNALLPGGTDTPMGKPMAATPESRAWVEGLHALKRIAHPDEIAKAAAFLLSDDASFITGACVLADGGVSICRA